MSNDVKYICDHCNCEVGYKLMPIQCDSCQKWFHGKCEKITRNEWSVLGSSNDNWHCTKCKSELFPFNKLDNDEFLNCVSCISQELRNLQKRCMFLEKSVKQNKIEKHLSNSCYLSRDQLSSMHNNILQSFSLIHFNCRSLKKNFDSIDNLLHGCSSKFSVIALSETWMNDANGDCFSLYELPGYKAHNVNRQNKKGGGTALYVKSELDHTFIHELSYTVENCFEVVTVEIKLKNHPNIVAVCLYRPPDVNMKVFLDNLSSFLNKLKNKKVFMCGDFNIDLLKSESDYDTGKFLDLMLSFGQYPLIRLPTRIQETSCTAIDNIFTNITESEVISNILIDDVTDHLPVLCRYNINVGHTTKSTVSKKKEGYRDKLK